ncbi:MAG TPA: hypothetical protein VN671_13580, partial [Solirubrobacterales bacterium]|nr:hypothetical protein [Solirubrobacterales bacterium]
SHCAMEGGELPRGWALRLFIQQAGVETGLAGEWTSDVSAPDPASSGSMVLEPNGLFVPALRNEARQYRCVTPLVQ